MHKEKTSVSVSVIVCLCVDVEHSVVPSLRVQLKILCTSLQVLVSYYNIQNMNSLLFHFQASR